MADPIPVSNDELHTIRDAMRGLNRLVDDLEAGRLDKIVLTQHNRMRAVVIPVDVYAQFVALMES
jgi:PHD/YefM family antitoxin component YafN of YafNO toxin-antitoxin module